MKIENYNLSGFTDIGKTGIQIRLKGHVKLDNEVNMLL